MNRTRRNCKEDGMVLVIVLWLITCIALLVAAFNGTVKSGSLATRNEITTIKAIPLLDAGVELASFHLNAKDEQHKWIADGREYRQQIAGKWISLRIFDENGKVDLNKAKPELMTNLFQRHVQTQSQAQDIAMAILKIRDARTGNDAQAFVHVSQLLQVPGVSYGLYRKLLPFVTVYNPRGTINTKTAAREVMLALPGMTPIEVDEKLALRGAATANDIEISPPVEAGKAPGTGRAGPAYTVVVRRDVGRGADALQTAVTILARSTPAAPFHVLAWRSTVR